MMLKLVKNNDRLDMAIARLNIAAKSARRENDREDARVILKALSRIKNNDSNDEVTK